MNSALHNNYLLNLAYDGSKYYGWAIQPDRISVQGEFKQIFDHLFTGGYKWSVAGRTDRGVHAMNQIVSLSTPINFSEIKLCSILNRRLPSSIYIKHIDRTEQYIDIRRNATKREYRYKIADETTFDPFQANYKYFLNFKHMDFDLIKKSIKLFIGEHNFYNFSSSKKNVVFYKRNIDKFMLFLGKKSGYFIIRANSFLYNMVRRIIGTLFLLGTGKIDMAFIEMLLNSKENMRTKTKLIKPNGLYLWRVYY